MNKFPWTQYVSTLLFYLIIIGAVIVIGSALPKPEPKPAPQMSEEQKMAQAQQINQQVLAQIGSLMVLPEGTPQISMVYDLPSFLSQNPGLSNTKAGDVVVLYPNQIIVYSPTNNKIVYTQPVNQVAPSQAVAPIQPVTPTEPVNESETTESSV